jgi:hypothetical protein
MVHRIALIAGGLAAAAVLAIALGVAGFIPQSPGAQAADPTPPVAQVPATRTVTDTVYVKPVPKQQVIHVTKTAPAPSAAAKPPLVIVKHVSHHDDSNDDRGEGD